MLHFLRKHTILAALIFGATILSFVFFMGNPGGGSGQPSETDAIGSIDGRAVTIGEYRQAYNEAQMNFLFRFGQMPDRNAAQYGFDINKESANRLLAIHLQSKTGIQAPDSAVIGWIREMPLFRTQEAPGIFDKATYDLVVKTNLPQRGISQETFTEFARHEIANQVLSGLGGLAGEMVTPLEAKENLRQELKKAKVQLVAFKSSEFTDQVQATDEAIQEYYDNNQALYRDPEKLIVNYIEFSVTNYLAEARLNMSTNVNLETSIADLYINRGADTFRDESGQLMDQDAAYAQIRDEIEETAAKFAARKAANEFASLVVEGADEKTAAGTAFSTIEFFNLNAEEGGHEILISSPFSRYQTLTDLNVGRDFNDVAYNLTETDAYSVPVEGEDGYYVLCLNTRVPSKPQPLAQVRATVEARFKTEKLRELVREAGIAFHANLTNSIAGGLNFSEAVAASGMELVEPPTFNLRTTSLPEFDSIAAGVAVTDMKNAAFGIAPGETTDYISARQNGFILHLVELLEAEEIEIAEKYEETLKDMQGQRRIAAFTDWFNHQLEVSDLQLAIGGSSSDEESEAPVE